jgi:hypothetical protein
MSCAPAAGEVASNPADQRHIFLQGVQGVSPAAARRPRLGVCTVTPDRLYRFASEFVRQGHEAVLQASKNVGEFRHPP